MTTVGVVMKIKIKGAVLINKLSPRMLMVCLLGFLTIVPVTAYAFRDDVLVIVNDNSIDSPQIGAYYAQQRNINPANIVHVRIRNGYFINWGEFLSLRDQIIAFMQANTLDDPTLIPAACVDGDLPYYCPAAMQQLRQHTKIRYLVTTRGIPTRMTVTGSSLFAAAAPTSVDNYLKYWLINYFTSDVTLKFTEREQAFMDGRGMRTVIPSVDKELIVGRIDGLNQEAALNLVDRAIQAEQNGIYGNLLSNTQVLHWKNHLTNRTIYQPIDGFLQSWRYQMGIFGESRFECLDYLNFPLASASGLTPLDCHVQMTPAKERGPANTVSRQPLANDTLMYSGWLDGSVSASNFNGLLNWRKQPSCNVLLCENSATPDACRAASTDVYREINTQCVGVADGFIGYNHQSYPVSFLSSWPTYWYPDLNNTNWNSKGGGDSFKDLAFPEIIEFYGLGDRFSLWFRSSDQIYTPVCYIDSSFTSTESCRDQRRINLNQKVSFAEKSLDVTTPARFNITFWYRAFGVTSTTDLQVRLFVHESGAGNKQIDYGIHTLGNIPVGNSSWKKASVIVTLDPALHNSLFYDGIKLRLQSSGLFAGNLVIDNVTVTDLETNQNLIQNGLFSEGHKQVAMGDYAASFLSRLNGTAFWGSVSHHQSGGAAFTFNQLEILVYFMRGLPLGDAVWFDESQNSGVLYGDPLYSPVSVYLHPVNVDDNLQGIVELTGDVVNGQAPDFVDTQYTVDFCDGTDFYICDLDPFAWTSTGINGVGGQKNMSLGQWDTSLMIPGEYVLRLAVSSTNLTTGKNQIFYDYYPVTVGNINTPPEATAALIQINEDTAGSSQIRVIDPDIGDNHSYKILLAPKLGTATVSASGLVNYIPFNDQNGMDIVFLMITDSAGNTVNLAVRVIINSINDAPKPTAHNFIMLEDTAGTTQILHNDPDVGDVHIYTIVSSPTKLGVATVSATGLVTFTPNANSVGLGSVTANVSDAAGASVNFTFVILVLQVNDAPVVSAPAINTDAGITANSQISVNDPDIGDSHTYSIATMPIYGTVQLSLTGLVTYTPDLGYSGADQLVITVTDAAGASSNVTISVTIAPIPVTENSTVKIFTIPNDSPVTIEGTIEGISGVWVRILGKSIYVPSTAPINYKSEPDNPVLNVGDHVKITASSIWTFLVASNIDRNNSKSKMAVTGPVSFKDPDNQRLGIAYIYVQADNNTNYKNFTNNLNPMASITENTVLTAELVTLPSGDVVAKQVKISI